MFSAPKFSGRRTPKIRCGHFIPYGDTSSTKVWCNSPNRSRFLANFRISGAKNCWGQTHPHSGVQ